MERQTISFFQGKENVTHIISTNGTEAYLTQSRSFADETNRLGACKLNTVENETKHVLFLFNSADAEVGRYYMGKRLRGKSLEELVKNRNSLIFFESWNLATNKWVPCVGFAKKQKLEMSFYVSEVDINAKGYFQKIEKEIWTIGEKCIVTPHGDLTVNDVVFVDNGPLVGVQFSVVGQLCLNNLKCSTGKENTLEIKTFALLRQPNNVWLWGYAFDGQDNPVVNFCGYDDFDDFANFIPSLKQLVNKEKKTILSKWRNDTRLLGVWYNANKSVHPVLKSTDYTLTVNCFNEDGTMFEHHQLGVKDMNFSNNIIWGKYVFKWKTNDDEIMITNEELDIKREIKYKCENGVLTLNNTNYFRTMDEAINAINS